MRVQRVGLAPQPPSSPILPGDFDDAHPRGGQGACEASSVRAGALDTDAPNVAMFTEERDDLRAAAAVGTELTIRDRRPPT